MTNNNNLQQIPGALSDCRSNSNRDYDDERKDNERNPSTPEITPSASSYGRSNPAITANCSLASMKGEAKAVGFSPSVSPVPSVNFQDSRAITAAASVASMKEVEPKVVDHTNLTPPEISRTVTLDPPSKWWAWRHGSKNLPEITIRRSIFFGLWAAIHIVVLVVKIYAYPDNKFKGFCKATIVGIMVCLIAIYICMSPTFLYILNRSILPRAITFEKNIHTHKVAAYTLVFWTILHVIAYYYRYISYHIDVTKHPEKAKGKKQMSLATMLLGRYYGWTGHIILLFYILMFATSVWVVRHKRFELFYYVHQLHIPITVLLFFHGKNEEFYMFLSGPLAVYVVDRLYRLIRGYLGHTSISAVIQHPSNVYEIRIKKRWFRPTRPGQYIRINCPTVAPLQWHPFTLTSAPEEDEMVVHIKVVGDWTNELSKVLGCDFNITRSLSSLSLNEMYDTDAIYNPKLTTTDYVEEESGARYKTSVKVTVPRLSGFEESAKKRGVLSRCKGFVKSIREVEEGGIKRSNTVLSTAKTDFKPTAFDDDSDTFTDVVIPKIFVDGSYEAPAESIFKYKITVMIGAGIGVTPFASVLRSIRCKLRQSPDKLKMQKVYFFWVCRDMRSFEWFKELLISLEKDGLSNLIEFRTFFTGPIPQGNGGKTGAPTLTTTENDPFGSLKIANTIGGQTYIGRPHFESLVGHIGSLHPDSKLGIFYCGPKSLRTELRVIAHRWDSQLNKSQKTKIDFHAEHF